jgi:hypothetical protein
MNSIIYQKIQFCPPPIPSRNAFRNRHILVHSEKSNINICDNYISSQIVCVSLSCRHDYVYFLLVILKWSPCCMFIRVFSVSGLPISIKLDVGTLLLFNINYLLYFETFLLLTSNICIEATIYICKYNRNCKWAPGNHKCILVDNFCFGFLLILCIRSGFLECLFVFLKKFNK